MTIVRLNVGEVAELDRGIWGHKGRVWALWPSPVDHDQCFQAAGFEEFADTDDDWDREFGELGLRIVQALQNLGSGRVQAGQYRLGESGTEALHEAIIAGTKDDSVQPSVVSFGEPPLASVRTSDGHAIFWIWLSVGELGPELASIANGLDVRTTTLQWAHLLPIDRPKTAPRPWWRLW